jgi:hypothetical protein
MNHLVALIMIAFLVPTAAMAKGECQEDKAKFCEDVKASGGDVGDCLKQHIEELSPACKKDKFSEPESPGQSETKP